MAHTQITVQVDIHAPRDVVWKALTSPEDIVEWNAASDDWHTTKSTVDLRVGGRFSSTMAAKDGSHSFDFAGTYTAVETDEKLVYELDDQRTVSTVLLALEGNETRVVETFDAEGTHSIEQQEQGWQAILNNFKKHVEAAKP